MRVDGRSIAVGGPRQRAVLAALLLSPNRVVSIDSLIEKVWNGRPPSTARTQVAICVAALRKLFRAAGCEQDAITTATPGYMLNVAGRSLDCLGFEQLVEQAAEWSAAARTAEAAALLRDALALWRGPALGGVFTHFAEAEADRLDEQRMLAVEQHMALRLELGEHHAILGELRALVQASPLRDRLRFYLMLAQYRSGRRAEALNTFREGTRHSIEEIGLELSAELQALHDSILRDEFPQFSVPAITATAQERQPAPCQLPEQVAHFAGRADEQWLMDETLLPGSGGSPVGIAYVTGSPGIGKTGLVTQWAHRSARRFPDGQLYADLRESGPLETLHGFLRGMGVTERPLPAGLEECAALYRSMLDGRRVLVVLDHASSYAQLRPLLPGSGECCVLITGRDGLDELVNSHNALRMRIGPLTPEQSLELLSGVLRDARVEESTEASRRLAALCGHVPPALRAAAARLVTKQHWRVADLVRRLERSGNRLDELSLGEDSLRARLDRSVCELPAEVAFAYHRLGALDEANFDAARGAEVLSTGLTDAEDLLEALVDAQLLEVVGRDAWGEMRYRWQELVRLHALGSRVPERYRADLTV